MDNRDRLLRLVVEDYRSFLEDMVRNGMTPDHIVALDSLPEEDYEPDIVAETLQDLRPKMEDMSDEELKKIIVEHPNEFAAYLATEGMSERLSTIVEELENNEFDGSGVVPNSLEDEQL